MPGPSQVRGFGVLSVIREQLDDGQFVGRGVGRLSVRRGLRNRQPLAVGEPLP